MNMDTIKYNRNLFTITDFTETPTDSFTFQYKVSVRKLPGKWNDFRIKWIKLRANAGTEEKYGDFSEYDHCDLSKIPYIKDKIKITKTTKITFGDGEQFYFNDLEAILTKFQQWKNNPTEWFIKRTAEDVLKQLLLLSSSPATPTA